MYKCLHFQHIIMYYLSNHVFCTFLCRKNEVHGTCSVSSFNGMETVERLYSKNNYFCISKANFVVNFCRETEGAAVERCSTETWSFHYSKVCCNFENVFKFVSLRPTVHGRNFRQASISCQTTLQLKKIYDASMNAENHHHHII